MVAVIPAQAWGQCAGGTDSVITCTGTVSDGYVITQSGTLLTVDAGATLSNTGGDALSVAMPSTGLFYTRTATINVNGVVTASGGAGIAVLSGSLASSNEDFAGTSALVIVGESGTIGGTYGIRTAQSAGNAYGATSLLLDNAGQISGTSGIAVYASNGNFDFSSIYNRATGRMGAIQASATILNDGLIDGGALSALAPSVGNASVYRYVTNSGTITSSSSSGTIAGFYAPVTNSGTISNTGMGSVFAGASYLTISNRVGGTISASGGSVFGDGLLSAQITNSGIISNIGGGTVVANGQGTLDVTNTASGVISVAPGNTAFSSAGRLNLSNQGAIVGNVVSGSDNSYVDSSQGTITGNLTFGAGNDILVATLRDGSVVTGVTGSIDGGGGVNTLQLATQSDMTLASAVALPTNFTRLDLAPAAGTTLTLASGYPVTSQLYFDGAGTLKNQANISGVGTVVGNLSYAAGSFINEGTISSLTSGDAYAVDVAAVFDNSGRISATGNGLNASSYSFSNSGTISAGSTAATVYADTGFTNSGTIQSSNGIALVLSISCCGAATNSGRIVGASAGLVFGNGKLANTGLITASGTAVMLGSNGIIDNQVGGVITGDGAAIGLSTSSTWLSQVWNAGTINGDVNIATTNSYLAYIGNTYISAPGGVLNGDLILGYGDTLVTALTGAGTSGFAGINGTVQANQSVLRYDVGADTTTTLALPAGFASVGYQVKDGATLTLDTAGTWRSAVVIAGSGNVVLNGTVMTNDVSALTSTALIQAGGYSYGIPAMVTNNGTLQATRNTPYTVMGTVILPMGLAGPSDAGGTTFVNNGTVRFADTSGQVYPSSYYGAVTAANVINSGTIIADGIPGVTANVVTNSGTITAGDRAVQLVGTAVTNSGAIVGTTGAAISSTATGSYYSAFDHVTNLAGGTITGAGDAIDMPGGVLRNAGTINGAVDLGAAQGYGRTNRTGVYIADGGTIDGNLYFGYGDDQLIETGAGFGVSGSIYGGPGTNSVGHLRSGTATVTLGSALPSGFTQEFILADGADARVTITGPAGYAGDIGIGGSGTIINELATTGGVTPANVGPYNLVPGMNQTLAGFVNRADIGLAWLSTASFDNHATIGSMGLGFTAVTVSSAQGLTFANSGTVVNDGTTAAVSLSAYAGGTSTVTNSGTIASGLGVFANWAVAGASPSTVSIANSGTISAFTPRPSPYWYDYGQWFGYAVYADTKPGDTVALANSGRIAGDIYLFGGNATLVNSGTITGNIVTGDGDDRLVMNGAFAGSIYAGAGNNALDINGGSPATPVAMGSVTGIGSLTQGGGFATVSGDASFGTVVLSGGRLVGLAGSVMNATSFDVQRGAVFGSAGTVNGNITVSGTLSPGASPGTMTVNGNVLLATGSTTIFEIAPNARDKLNITGTLTIRSGSTLQIVATTPVKVGSTLDLISASGGITGQFDTVTGLAGSLRTLANGDLGLLVQFANAPGYAPQVRRAITYINSAMAAANAPAALFPALDSLQDSKGAPIVAAFARLTPEPYADAMQIGTETALALASTTRTIGEAEARGDSHVFGFGQMLGGTRQFSANGGQGVSAATLNGYGGLVGLGVGGEGYAVAAYVGWMDRHQTIASLGASTKASGAIGGVSARFGGKTRITLAAGYDDADAFTRRAVPDAGVITASYSLPSWSFDASLSRTVALGDGWLLRPQLGTTWVRTSHDAIMEASAHPFALDVARARLTQGFVDAGFGFESAPDAASPWRRFVMLGLRYRVHGQQARAIASLAGSADGLEAVGVRRNRLSASLAAGVEYQVAAGATLFLTGSGELGAPSNGGSATAGLRFRL